MNVITLQLSSVQERSLAPIVSEASAMGNNVLFVATCAPDNDSWRLQATVIPARLGRKVLALLKKESAGATNSNVSRESRGGVE